MKMVKALRGWNVFLFICSTMTFGGPDDSIEKGDTVILSQDFPFSVADPVGGNFASFFAGNKTRNKAQGSSPKL